MGLVVGAQFDWLGHFLNPCGKSRIRRKGTPEMALRPVRCRRQIVALK
ncbi:hypothetical protein AK973_2040 [Pseudomonas brassicacearum]|nr:hypothetical protein AK973_2040 [Pseudomonas brassicacearum]